MPRMTSGRWRECTKFEDEAMRRFVQEYFGRADRSILLVAAAGFDERSTVIPGVLAKAAAARTRLIALREERRRPDAELVAQSTTPITRAGPSMSGEAPHLATGLSRGR